MISAYLRGGAETTISLLIRKQPFPLGQKKDLLLEKTKQPSVLQEETHKPSPLREKTKKTISLREKTKKTNSLSREFKNKLPPFLEKTTNTQPPFRENVIVLRLLIHPLPLACLESDSMSSVRRNSRCIPGKVGGAQIPGIAALPGRGWAGQICQRIGGEIEGLKCKSTEKPVARLSSLTDFCKRFRPQEVATLMLPSEREEGERGVNTKQFARHTVPARSTHMDLMWLKSCHSSSACEKIRIPQCSRICRTTSTATTTGRTLSAPLIWSPRRTPRNHWNGLAELLIHSEIHGTILRLRAVIRYEQHPERYLALQAWRVNACRQQSHKRHKL